MPTKIDISINDRFGKLTVINEFSKPIYHRWFECRCDCGNTFSVSLKSLRNNGTQSCGCIQRLRFSKVNYKHGLYKTRLNSIWKNMRQRCYNPKATRYENYGGRGIVLCNEWKGDFTAFYKWAIANGYSEELTIDRKKVDGNYEPRNCRWVTRKAQNFNTTRSRILTYNGVTKTATEWALEIGMGVKTLTERLKRLSVEDSLTMPLKKH